LDALSDSTSFFLWCLAYGCRPRSGDFKIPDVDALDNLLFGFSIALAPLNLFWCFAGVLLGTMVGVLPGIGPAGTLAILLPLTFHMQPTTALIMLLGIYYGAKYGGSTTSILLNIPGESSSVVT
jgi:putative tricarboxylic transport membrane protein